MIRVSTTATALIAAIESQRPGWMLRAKARTDALAADGPDPEFPSLWVEIKEIYIRLQSSKCIYCEKELEDQPIEQDVEHYRPKKKVARWKVPRSLAGEGIVVHQPARGDEPGYSLLAYHLLNYATSCKTCNSILKKNYFPIAGVRNYISRDPQAMTGERPFLLYPIGDADDDPEDLIEFAGLSPQPRGTGFKRQRALVTIWNFQLNRKWLQKDRALEIMRLYLALDRSARSSHDKTARDAKRIVEHMGSPRARHANCLRSFRRLYDSDPAAAERTFQACTRLISTLSR